MATSLRQLLLLVSLATARYATACIFKFGSSPDSLAAPSGGTHWNHGMMGDDWDGVDASGKPWVCKTGKRQSPINVPTYHVLDGDGSKVASPLQTRWSYPDIVSSASGNVTTVEVINNGHTIQVEWTYDYAGRATIAIPADYDEDTPITAVLDMRKTDKAERVNSYPIQFHFHASSEHLLAGKMYPLELHVVHKVTEKLPACAGGCFSVTGILFQLDNGPDNHLLDAIWEHMPSREGAINYLPAGARIPLGKLLPATADRDYVTYEGSLTTPPCSEGLLWHVLTQPQKISYSQWAKYRAAVGMKECTAKNATAPAEGTAMNSTAAGNTTGHHHHRRMLNADVAAAPKAGEHSASGNPDDYTCKVAAYGANYRNPQYNNQRTIKLARAS